MSTQTEIAARPEAVARFAGAGRTLLVCGATGAVGLGLTAVGLFVDAPRALYAYLTAFTYWAGIAVAALVMLCIFHAAKARWMVALRRIIESIAVSLLVFVPLFLPIALGMERVFPWVSPSPTLGAHARHLLHEKTGYLNVPFFLTRTAAYFLVWVLVSHLLHRWSTRQDSDGDVRLTTRQRRLGAGALPALALTFTFASFDWLMSLHPLWQSTIFGVYYFAGSFLGCIALLTIITVRLDDSGVLGGPLPIAHFHSLGKLLLAFVAFWAYIAFSQFMLIWVANLPEETPWYQLRSGGPWRPVGIALAVGHFILPFFVLLSRAVKVDRHWGQWRPLWWVASWIMLFHFVDVYWLVMPAHSAEPSLSWLDLAAMMGVGGTAFAFGLWRLRGHFPVPVKDPYLAESLRYVTP